MIKTVFGIFRIKREERWLAVFAFIWMVALNVLTITKYYDKFTQIMDTYHRHFVNNFHIFQDLLNIFNACLDVPLFIFG